MFSLVDREILSFHMHLKTPHSDFSYVHEDPLLCLCYEASWLFVIGGRELTLERKFSFYFHILQCDRKQNHSFLISVDLDSVDRFRWLRIAIEISTFFVILELGFFEKC